jgi:hypothetical protein
MLTVGAALLSRIYQPEVVAGIGKKGLAVLQQTFPEQSFDYIRHPSYGGKGNVTIGPLSLNLGI